MTRQIPVTVFTGFLGAGKTTLVNWLIQHYSDLKIGIIINEFGEVGVDSGLIQTSEELKVEVSNGCACCVVRSDLQAGVAELLRQVPDLDYILVEASGLAEPLPIAQTFMHNLSQNLETYLDGLVCVVDSQRFVQNWDEFETLRKQLEYSDFVVLTKVAEDSDLVGKTKELIQKVRPGSVVLEFDEKSDSTEPAILLDSHAFDMTPEVSQAMEHEAKHHHHHDHFDEVVYISQRPLDPLALDEVFKLPEFQKLIRAKGLLNLQNQDMTMVFQLVGHGRQLSPYHRLVDQSRLVMIGKDLDSEIILQAIQSCER